MHNSLTAVIFNAFNAAVSVMLICREELWLSPNGFINHSSNKLSQFLFVCFKNLKVTLVFKNKRK